MTRLGQLERATMDALWAHPDGVLARQLNVELVSKPALTTVLTVLERLTRKGLVTRTREGRAHRYTARLSKEAFVAEAMRTALAGADDVGAALTHFLGEVPPDQVVALRAALNRLEDETP